MEECHRRNTGRVSFTQRSIYDPVPTFKFPAGGEGNEESHASRGSQMNVGENRRRGRSTGSRTKRRLVLNRDNFVAEEPINGTRPESNRSDVRKTVMEEILKGKEVEGEIKKYGKCTTVRKSCMLQGHG